MRVRQLDDKTIFVRYSVFADDEVQPKALPSAIFFSLTTNNKSVLRQIKTRTDISCDAFGYYYLAEERHVEERRKSGSVCKRIVVGFALVAFAFQDGRAIQGWHWAGLAGFVLLVTAFFKSCPVYSVLGISTCERPVERT